MLGSIFKFALSMVTYAASARLTKESAKWASRGFRRGVREYTKYASTHTTRFENTRNFILKHTSDKQLKSYTDFRKRMADGVTRKAKANLTRNQYRNFTRMKRAIKDEVAFMPANYLMYKVEKHSAVTPEEKEATRSFTKYYLGAPMVFSLASSSVMYGAKTGKRLRRTTLGMARRLSPKAQTALVHKSAAIAQSAADVGNRITDLFVAGAMAKNRMTEGRSFLSLVSKYNPAEIIQKAPQYYREELTRTRTRRESSLDMVERQVNKLTQHLKDRSEKHIENMKKRQVPTNEINEWKKQTIDMIHGTERDVMASYQKEMRRSTKTMRFVNWTVGHLKMRDKAIRDDLKISKNKRRVELESGGADYAEGPGIYHVGNRRIDLGRLSISNMRDSLIRRAGKGVPKFALRLFGVGDILNYKQSSHALGLSFGTAHKGSLYLPKSYYEEKHAKSTREHSLNIVKKMLGFNVNKTSPEQEEIANALLQSRVKMYQGRGIEKGAHHAQIISAAHGELLLGSGDMMIHMPGGAVKLVTDVNVAGQRKMASFRLGGIGDNNYMSFLKWTREASSIPVKLLRNYLGHFEETVHGEMIKAGPRPIGKILDEAESTNFLSNLKKRLDIGYSSERSILSKVGSVFKKHTDPRYPTTLYSKKYIENPEFVRDMVFDPNGTSLKSFIDLTSEHSQNMMDDFYMQLLNKTKTTDKLIDVIRRSTNDLPAGAAHKEIHNMMLDPNMSLSTAKERTKEVLSFLKEQTTKKGELKSYIWHDIRDLSRITETIHEGTEQTVISLLGNIQSGKKVFVKGKNVKMSLMDSYNSKVLKIMMGMNENIGTPIIDSVSRPAEYFTGSSIAEDMITGLRSYVSGEKEISSFMASSHLSKLHHEVSSAYHNISDDMDDVAINGIKERISNIVTSMTGSANYDDVLTFYSKRKKYTPYTPWDFDQRIKVEPTEYDEIFLIPKGVSQQTIGRRKINLGTSSLVEIADGTMDASGILTMSLLNAFNRAASEFLGIGFEEATTRTPMEYFKKMATKRIFPGIGLYLGYSVADRLADRFLDSTVLGEGLTVFGANILAGGRLAAQGMLDFTHITDASKYMEDLMPGSIDSPASGIARGLGPVAVGMSLGARTRGPTGALMGGIIGSAVGMLLGGGPIGAFGIYDISKSRKELVSQLTGETEIAVKKGRFWELSSTPFEGQGIDYYRPGYYSMLRSKYKQAPGLKDSIFSEVVGTIAPDYYAMKNYYSRPYPTTAGLFSNIPVFSNMINLLPGSSLLGSEIMMHEDDYSPAFLMGQMEGSGINTTEIARDYIDSQGMYGNTKGSTGGFPSQDDVNISYDERMLMAPTPMNRSDTEWAVGEAISNVKDIVGLRGFLMGTMFEGISGRQDLFDYAPDMANPVDIAGFQREYWEKDLGGILGACLHKDTYIDTIIGPKKISQLSLSDKVLTKDGSYKKVTTIFKRKPDNNQIYTIKYDGISEPLKITGNHNVVVYHKKQYIDKNINYSMGITYNKVRVDTLQEGDYLIRTVPQIKELSSIIVDMSLYIPKYHPVTENYIYYKNADINYIKTIEYIENNLTILFLSTKEISRIIGVPYNIAKKAVTHFRRNKKIMRWKRYVEINQQLAYFIGWHVVKGSIDSTGTVLLHMYKEEKAYATELSTIINDNLDKVTNVKVGKSNKNSLYFRFDHIPFSHFLKELTGDICHNRNIPYDLWINNKDIAIKYLKGMFLGSRTFSLDRKWKNDNYNFKTTSVALSSTFHTLLSSLGISSSISILNTNGSNKIIYHISINTYNSIKLYNILNIPVDPSICKKYITDNSQIFIKNGFIHYPIRSIKIESYNGNVYDLEVESIHYYHANLVCVSNSEIIRRYIPHKRRQIQVFNPIRNLMPSYLPGADYYIDFQHGDPFSAIPYGEARLPGACLTANSVVTTSNTILSADNININDSIIDGQGNVIKTENVWKRYIENEDVYNLKLYNNFQNYRPVILTEEHEVFIIEDKGCRYYKFYGNEERKQLYKPIDRNFCTKLNCNICFHHPKWKKIKDVKKGDYVLIPISKENDELPKFIEVSDIINRVCSKTIKFPDNILLTKSVLWIFGCWVANGNINKNGKISFIINKDGIKFLTDMLNKFKKDTGFKFDINISEKYDKKLDGTSYNVEVYINSLILSYIIKYFFGSSKSKKVDLDLSKKQIKSFLSGWLWGDSYSNNEKIHLGLTVSVKYPKLVDWIHNTVNMHGLLVNVTYMKDKSSKLLPAYIITFDPNDLDISLIGTKIPNKDIRLGINIKDEKYCYIKVQDNIKEKYTGYVYDYRVPTTSSFVTNFIVHNSYEAIHDIDLTFPIEGDFIGMSIDDQIGHYLGLPEHVHLFNKYTDAIEPMKADIVNTAQEYGDVIKKSTAVYNPTYDSHATADAILKTINGEKRALKIVPRGFAGESSLNAFMVMSDIDKGILLEVDQGGTTEKLVTKDIERFTSDLQNARTAAHQAYSQISSLTEEGKAMNMANAYSWFDRFKILADVAEYSPQFREAEAIVKQQLEAGLLKPNQIGEISRIKDQVNEKMKAFDFDEYRFLHIGESLTPYGRAKDNFYSREYNMLERLVGSAFERVSHLRNPIQSKLLHTSDPLEEYEKTSIYGKCLTYNTSVITYDNIKTVSEITIKDKVWTKNGWSNINNIDVRYIGDTEKVFCVNSSLSTINDEGLTEDHPIYIYRNGIYQYMPIRNITKEDYLVYKPLPIISKTELHDSSFCLLPYIISTCKKLNIDLSNFTIYNNNVFWVSKDNSKLSHLKYTDSIQYMIKKNNKLFRLIGYYLAEGNISYDEEIPAYVSFKFNYENENYINETLSLIYTIFGISAKTYDKPEENSIEIVFESKVFACFMYSFSGDNSFTKIIPNILYNNSSAFDYINLIETYISKKGTYNKSKETYSIVVFSKRLGLQIQSIAISMGILCQIDNIYQEKSIFGYMLSFTKIGSKQYEYLKTNKNCKHQSVFSKFSKENLFNDKNIKYDKNNDLILYQIYNLQEINYYGVVYDIGINNICHNFTICTTGIVHNSIKMWDNPIEDYAKSYIYQMAGEDDPIQGMVSWGTGGLLLGGSPLGIAMAAGGAITGAVNKITGNTFIPDRVEKRREIIEQMDTVKYAKFMKLYNETGDTSFALKASKTITGASLAGTVLNSQAAGQALGHPENDFLQDIINNVTISNIHRVKELLPAPAVATLYQQIGDKDIAKGMMQGNIRDEMTQRQIPGIESTIYSDNVPLESAAITTLRQEGIDEHDAGLGWYDQMATLVNLERAGIYNREDTLFRNQMNTMVTVQDFTSSLTVQSRIQKALSKVGYNVNVIDDSIDRIEVEIIIGI